VQNEKKSVSKKLRVYANTNCAECNPVKYKVVGSTSSSFDASMHSRMLKEFVIAEGTLPWIDDEDVRKNPNNTLIESTYESGDNKLIYTEVDFLDNELVFEKYLISFDENRGANTPLIVGEVELVGVVYEVSGQLQYT
jgi:hypothetical protein